MRAPCSVCGKSIEVGLGAPGAKAVCAKCGGYSTKPRTTAGVEFRPMGRPRIAGLDAPASEPERYPPRGFKTQLDWLRPWEKHHERTIQQEGARGELAVKILKYAATVCCGSLPWPLLKFYDDGGRTWGYHVGRDQWSIFVSRACPPEHLARVIGHELAHFVSWPNDCGEAHAEWTGEFISKAWKER